MERHDRAPVATFFAGRAFAAGENVGLGEDAAHHARVKRLETGDPVRITDGAGTIGSGEITELRRADLIVAVHDAEHVPAPPAIHLRAPVADRDRMLWLAEKATELGVASWQAVRFRRSMSVSPRGEGAAFAEKVRARMRAAIEQSGGAWLPEILPELSVEALTPRDDEVGILLDAAGAPIGDIAARASTGAPVVLVGPEGGIEPAERARLLELGWQPARLAPSTLRFETAGVAAIAVLRALRL